jgi:hypothetical protein
MRWWLFAALALAGCNDGLFEVDLERMIDQRYYRAYQASEYFADGRSMRTPPADTVARDRVVDPELAEGRVDGVWIDRLPLAIDRGVIERGRDRFDVFCAPCHGIAGDGDSIVAANMQLRRPPSIVDARVRAFPVGRIFGVVTHGYGMMRSYAEDLSVDERWATMAYLRALQVRTGVPLDALPLAMRERAERDLRQGGEGETR